MLPKEARRETPMRTESAAGPRRTPPSPPTRTPSPLRGRPPETPWRGRGFTATQRQARLECWILGNSCRPRRPVGRRGAATAAAVVTAACPAPTAAPTPPQAARPPPSRPAFLRRSTPPNTARLSPPLLLLLPVTIATLPPAHRLLSLSASSARGRRVLEVTSTSRCLTLAGA